MCPPLRCLENEILNSGLDNTYEISSASYSGKDIHRVETGYFEGYSNMAIHKEMCEDKIRIEAFQKAIELSCKGKTVVDDFAGSGVLSFMAVQAGASKVYAIEKAEIWKKFKKEIKSK